MPNSLIRYLIGLAILFCMLVSCNQGEVYYKFSPIPKNEWGKNQEICFLLDSTSFIANKNYAISVELTHNVGYQYKNLFLVLEHTLQDSIPARDTIEFVLVDDHGKWLGAGNGPTRQLSQLYKANMKIDTALHNEITIRHAMQNLKLKGIEKIGLKIY